MELQLEGVWGGLADQPTELVPSSCHVKVLFFSIRTIIVGPALTIKTKPPWPGLDLEWFRSIRITRDRRRKLEGHLSLRVARVQ
jgi:hypothetical protein